jgi:ParB family transcriptional regulator, chromosome partitioning protein
MSNERIEILPIAEIHIPNPRFRNKLVFESIVSNIGTVGLKRPITVSRRQASADETKYDLVCGQGRLEACLALGEREIPALVIDVPREQQYLMSLVENIARRPPSNRDLLREIRALKGRGYKTSAIAAKLGLDRSYICGIVKLLDHGEARLIEAVEARRLPLTIATEIANGSNEEVRRALSRAYEKGDLRGTKLAVARRIIAQRLAKDHGGSKGARSRKEMSTNALVKEYHRHAERNRTLVNKSVITNQRLLLLVSMIRRLLADDNFVTLLRAESLRTMPEYLATRLK